jgi:hypothetical protein
MYRFSQNLARVAGIVLPVGETLRRWGSWWDNPWSYLNDVFMGAFFLAAAWMSSHRGSIGARYLAASYGFACAIGCSSLAVTIAQIDRTDPAGVSGAAAALVKALMLGLCVAGLIGALHGRPNQPADE